MTISPSKAETDLGSRVRVIRLSQRLTQAELADRANVSLGALKHLESGAGATVRTLTRVITALGRTDWIDALTTPKTFSPLAVLEQQRREQTEHTRRQRVRRTS